MGAVLLVLAYLATAALCWLLVSAGDRRPSAMAALVLTVVPLIYTAGGFLPGKTVAPTVGLAGVPPWANPVQAELMAEGSSARNPLLFDALTQFIPWRQAARDDLLFNPAQAGGAALLGNAQSAALFPLELVARVLPPVRAETYLAAGRLALAVWGFFLLARRLALSEHASLAAALAFSGAGFLQLWRAHPHSYVLALLPWVIWALVGIVRSPGPRSAALLAAAGAVSFLAGHPETLLQALIFALAVTLPASLGFDRSHGGKVLGWGLVAALLSGLLAAPALLPFVENLAVSAEWAVRGTGAHDAIEWPLYGAVARLVPTVFHYGMGDPVAGTWWGPENLLEWSGGSVGAAVLILVPLAFLLPGRRKTVLLWLGVGILGLLVGAHFPIISKPFGWVPLLRETFLKRLVFWWAMAAPLLAGMGVDALAARRGRRLATITAACVAGLLALALWGYPESRNGAGLTPELVGLALGLAAVALLGQGQAEKRRWAAGLAVLALAVLAPRAALFSRWVPIASAHSFYPKTEAIEYLEPRAPGYRVAGLNAALVPHSAAFFELEDARGYDPLIFGPFERFSASYGTKEDVGWHRIFDPERPALDFLGVRYLVDHPYVGERPGVDRVYAGFDAVVFENPEAFERIFTPHGYTIHEDADSALDAALTFDDFAIQAAVSAPGLRASARAENGQAEIRDLVVERSGRIAATVVAEGRTLIASSQPAIPGWRLRIDGEAGERVRVNGAFLGTFVPAGEHRIEWVYAPRSWTLGLFLAGLGMLALVGCWLGGAPGRKSS